MKKTIIDGVITNESDLLRFDAKKILSQLLETSEENMYELLKGKQVEMKIIAAVEENRIDRSDCLRLSIL